MHHFPFQNSFNSSQYVLNGCYPSRLLVSHSSTSFSFEHLSIRLSLNAQYLKPQTLNPYFTHMRLASLLLCFWWFFFLCVRQCPFFRESKESIDPSKAMSRHSPSSSFLQCYWTSNKNKVESWNVMNYMGIWLLWMCS